MKKIRGFTCGAMDLCHAGHHLMFEECKQSCDYLIVGLQVDPSIDRYGKNKPIMSLEERMIILSGIKYVDEVVVYGREVDLYNLLEKNDLKIDVRFLGEDWKNKEYTGCDLPIKCIFNSRNHNYSITELRRRIING